MGRKYEHLRAEERAALMLMRDERQGVRAIGRRLGRTPSSISRELRRNGSGGHVYDASRAGVLAEGRRCRRGRRRKLARDTGLFGVVEHSLREGWSPERIAGGLKRLYPNETENRVSHETIHQALYVLPRGELRKALRACLRQGRGGRRSRSRGQDRRGQIADAVSVHERPPEVEDRLIPGPWEGDLIKGAYHRSAVGTWVERTSEGGDAGPTRQRDGPSRAGRFQPCAGRRAGADAPNVDV